MGEDQTVDSDVKRAGRSDKPAASVKRRILALTPYLLLPIVVILIAHYVIDIRLDVSLTYFRLVVFCIAFAVGFLLCAQARAGLATSLLFAVVITLVTLLGMSGTVWLARGGGPLLPTSSREWQDMMDFAINLIPVVLLGHVLASFLQSTFPSFEPKDLASRATRSVFQEPGAATSGINAAEKLIRALTALIIAAAALYAVIMKFF
jgi:hypothetical protein